jgi:hypothetical protein
MAAPVSSRVVNCCLLESQGPCGHPRSGQSGVPIYIQEVLLSWLRETMKVSKEALQKRAKLP